MSRPPDQEVDRRAASPPSGTQITGTQVTVDRWLQGTASRATDEVAEEAPIALTYHGVPHVVMLATPANLEDLGYGFTLSEELVAAPEEIQSVEVAAVAEPDSSAASAATAATSTDWISSGLATSSSESVNP